MSLSALFFSVIVLSFNSLLAQKFVAEKSSVSFYSSAPFENIDAKNTKSSAVFDSSSDEIAFSIPIKEFQFPKSLMQEHFNEKYLESEKYPKSTFSGKIIGFKGNVSGVQSVTAVGKLMIHGITRDVTIPGTIERLGEALIMKSQFIVKLEDYKIKIPQLMWKNIAEQVEVTVEFTFKPKQ